MSKKKNTLQDLDDFLKQQAAALVTPDALGNTTEAQAIATESPNQGLQQVREEFHITESKQDPNFRKKLYDFIIKSLEQQKDSLPEDKMLINTALYLKSGGDWKNIIREYWRGR